MSVSCALQLNGRKLRNFEQVMNSVSRQIIGSSLSDEILLEEFRNKEYMQETPQELTLLSLKKEFVTLKNKEGNYIIILKLLLVFASLFGHPQCNNFCGYLQ
jgi:hypothetical protein